ncbi:Transposable element Tcb2 transposase [Araneus ventricosus]|uniref:Transposable element Tcb2 transposase n=1 Tax=Araneus ventricosus TaxID=182803 RepID=A0A4Y2H856_ARAVE|nr:Transposable element Tcb2 transposase [Araneus ventricosus]
MTITIRLEEDFSKRRTPGRRVRRHFSQLSEFERGLIIGMKTAGWLTCRVARQVDRSECAVRTYWEQWTRDGTHVWSTGSGASRKKTRREDRATSAFGSHSDSFHDTIRCRGASCSINHFQMPCGSESSIQAPCSCAAFNTEHQRLRLQWCHARATWNSTDWQNVVFSDESRFVLGTDDNRARVWRRAGERYNSTHVVARHTACTAGIMVWGAVTYASQSTLIVARGTLTGQRYVDDILRPFLNGLPGAIFQLDNARRHTARVAQGFLHHVQTLPWPARSPDLSLIEHVWDQLKRQMQLCHSVHDLEVAVQDLWVHLPQDNIRRLINTITDRVAACIVAGGGPTRS